MTRNHIKHTAASPRRLLAGLGLVVALLAILVAGGGPAAVQASPQAQGPTVPPSARDGHAIYQENCAPCHGSTGLGDGAAAAQLPNGATALADPDVARQSTPAEWFQVVKEGRMDLMMPPWKNRLSDEEIWNVVSFAFTLHTSDDEINHGQDVWEEQCAACHGDAGTGDGPQAAAAGLQMPDLTDLDFAASRSLDQWFQVASNGQGAMPSFSGTLSDEDIWASLEYARTFSYQPLVAADLPSGTGRLAGQVSNGTPGGGAVDGLTVTLRSFLQFEELQPQEVVVGPDGSFAFDELPTGADYVYLATTDYGGVSFASNVTSFEEGQTEVEVPLQVWETSTSPGDIRVNLTQWFVEYHQGALLIGELYRITHTGDHVYVGSQEVAPGRSAVLQFNLPPDAFSVALDGGEIGDRYFSTDDGLVDTQPLPPGQVQVLMRYLLPYDGTRATLAHSVPYPVDQLSVLVAEGPDVTSEVVQEVGPRTVGESQFIEYTATNVPAGETVSLSLRGLERAADVASATTGNSSSAVLAYHPQLVYGIAALAAVVVAGLVLLPVLRRRRHGTGQVTSSGAGEVPATDLARQRQQLLRSIAQLDDQYAAGEIDEDTYQSLRTAQKRNLLLLTRQMEQAEGAAMAEAGDGSPDGLEQGPS